MMAKNPILDKLHAVREQLLAESGGTLEGLVSRLQAEQERSGRTLLATRRNTLSTAAATPGDVPGENLTSSSGDP